MRYCMRFCINWHRNYALSNLELQYLLNKNQTSKFDHAYFLCQLRLKFIQYLILKLHSIQKWRSEGSSMLALLGSKIALSILDVYYKKWILFCFILTALYIAVTTNQLQLSGIWAEFKRWLHIYSWGKASSVLPNPTQKSTRCEIGHV